MVTAGNYDRRDVNLAVDFPLIEDRLFGKITAMSHNMDGFYTNVYDGESMGDKDTTAVRAYLKLVGDDGFEATLQYEHVDSNNGSPSIVNGSLPGGTVLRRSRRCYGNSVHPMYDSPCQPGQRCKAPSKYWSGNAQVPDVSNFTSKAPTLTMNWSMDWGDVTSITGYKDFRLHEYSDQDYAPVDLHRTDRETNGQQFFPGTAGAHRGVGRLRVTDRRVLFRGGMGSLPRLHPRGAVGRIHAAHPTWTGKTGRARCSPKGTTISTSACGCRLACAIPTRRLNRKWASTTS